MFAGVSYYKKTPHHGLYNFRLLCHNARVSTLCRAKRDWQKHGGAEKSGIPSFCPIHLSAFLKCRIKEGPKISDFSKNFGNISEKQPFPEIISDLFFSGSATVPVAVRGVSRLSQNRNDIF
jgi:hypothetical protein